MTDDEFFTWSDRIEAAATQAELEAILAELEHQPSGPDTRDLSEACLNTLIDRYPKYRVPSR
jgi:hypothetical protein